MSSSSSSSPTSQVSETLSQVQEQAKHAIQEYQASSREYMERTRTWLSNLIQNASDTVRIYVNRYPPLAAFLFILLVLASIPVSIFTIFIVATSIGTLSVALLGFSVVEGTMFVTSGGILLLVLAGVLVCSIIGFFWGYGAYLTYCATCKCMGTFKRGATAVTSKLGETAQQFIEQPPIGTSQSPFPGTSSRR
jgi:hypothetical protein